MIRSHWLVRAIREAPLKQRPFDHVALGPVFPEDAYRSLLEHLPRSSDYAELRHKDALRRDGTSCRLEFLLTNERLRKLDRTRRRFWTPAAQAFRDPAIVETLAKTFAAAVARRSLPPLPRTALRLSLLRDLPGYTIAPHEDIPVKLFTMQLYLPRDERQRHLGTSFYRRAETARLKKSATLPFLPNSGYSFPVTRNSWHGVDRIPPAEAARDSLMFIWYLDGRWEKLSAKAEQAVRSIRSRWRRER